MSKKVLIIGADSFTAKYVQMQLEVLNYRVFGSSLFPQKGLISCDISNKESVKKLLEQTKPDYLVHLAGISYVPHGNLNEIYQINQIGVLNILEILKDIRLPIRKILLPSSAIVYGNAASNAPVLDEATIPEPVNHYAISKLAMEHLAKLYWDDIPVIITRPFNYTGIGQNENFLIPKVIKHFLDKKKSIELGNLFTIREYNDVRFVAEVYVELLLNNVTSEIINICSGLGYTIQNIMEFCQQITGQSMEITVNQDFVRKNEILSIIGDQSKLFSIVKVRPINLQETLKWMLNIRLS